MIIQVAGYTSSWHPVIVSFTAQPACSVVDSYLILHKKLKTSSHSSCFIFYSSHPLCFSWFLLSILLFPGSVRTKRKVISDSFWISFCLWKRHFFTFLSCMCAYIGRFACAHMCVHVCESGGQPQMSFLKCYPQEMSFPLNVIFMILYIMYV